MRHRSTVLSCLQALIFSIFCGLVGVLEFFTQLLFGIVAGVSISDSCQARNVFQFIFILLIFLGPMKYGVVVVRSEIVIRIMSRIQQGVVKTSCNKNFNESYEKKDLGCTNEIGELVELVVKFFSDLFGASLFVLLSGALLGSWYLGVWVILVLPFLALPIFSIEAWSYRRKKNQKSLCLSDFCNTDTDLPKNMRDCWRRGEKEKIKSILWENTKRLLMEYADIAYKFLPILVVLSLVGFEFLASKFLVVGIILFSCIADGLSKMAKTWFTRFEMKKPVKDLRKITGCAKRDSESELTYSCQLLFGFAQFYKQKD